MTQASRDAFRQSLCVAAQGLLAERGENGVTMRAVAKVAGCGVATTYRYFEDKQALFSAVRVAGFNRIADRLDEAVQGQADAIVGMRAIGAAYLSFAVAEPDAFRVMYAVPHTARPAPVGLAIERSWQVVMDQVQSCVSQGSLAGDPQLIANVFWVSVHGLASLRQAGKLTRGRSAADLAGPVVDAALRAFAGVSS